MKNRQLCLCSIKIYTPTNLNVSPIKVQETKMAIRNILAGKTAQQKGRYKSKIMKIEDINISLPRFHMQG